MSKPTYLLKLSSPGFEERYPAGLLSAIPAPRHHPSVPSCWHSSLGSWEGSGCSTEQWSLRGRGGSEKALTEEDKVLPPCVVHQFKHGKAF